MPIDQTLPLSQASSGSSDFASNYSPEPSSTGTGFFSDAIEFAKNAATEIGGISTELPVGDFGALIQAQIQAQYELQTVSMVSNLEKSKHETKMAAIRNIRVS